VDAEPSTSTSTVGCKRGVVGAGVPATASTVGLVDELGSWPEFGGSGYELTHDCPTQVLSVELNVRRAKKRTMGSS